MLKIAADWPARPFDPKCRGRVPIDDVVVAQVRMVIAEWHPHDWLAARVVIKPEVAGTAADLAAMTVREVGLHFHTASRRGFAMRHTADVTITPCRPIEVPAGWTAPPKKNEEDHIGIARRLDVMPRAVLAFMHNKEAFRAVDKCTRRKMADGLRISVDNVGSALDVIRAAGVAASLTLVESARGWDGGIWLTPSGKLVASEVVATNAATKAVLVKRAQ